MKSVNAALSLADKGFDVFPVIANNKTPSQDEWQAIASQDPEKIKELFNGGENNIGLRTGLPYDDGYLFVLDIDVKEDKEGDKSLELLELTHGELPLTFAVKTPSGGVHYYFKSPHPLPNSVERIGPGIDIRGVGGYVVAPFSAIDGDVYGMDTRAPVNFADDWLVELAGKPIEREDRSKDLIGDNIDTDGAIMRAIDHLTNNAELAIEGAGGDITTYRVANELMDFGISETTTLELLLDHWNDRCSPPWYPDELALKVENAEKYRAKPIGDKSPLSDFEAITDEEQESFEDFQSKTNQFQLQYVLDIKPHLESNFLIEDVFTEGGSSVLYGPPNAGKTFVVMDMAWHIATNKRWANKRVNQGGVLYLALEGGYGVFNRITALKNTYTEPTDVHIETDIPFAVVSAPMNLQSGRKDANKIIKIVKEMEKATKTPIRLIVVDTLARAFGGADENSSSEMGKYVSNTDWIRFKTGAHVCSVHHAGKDVSRGARGSNAALGAVDNEWLVQGSNMMGSITPKKQRDMKYINPVGFRLEVVTLGQDQDGFDVTSCIVHKSETSGQEDFAHQAQIGGESHNDSDNDKNDKTDQKTKSLSLVKALARERLKSQALTHFTLQEILDLFEEVNNLNDKVISRAKKRVDRERQYNRLLMTNDNVINSCHFLKVERNQYVPVDEE